MHSRSTYFSKVLIETGRRMEANSPRPTTSSNPAASANGDDADLLLAANEQRSKRASRGRPVATGHDPRLPQSSSLRKGTFSRRAALLVKGRIVARQAIHHAPMHTSQSPSVTCLRASRHNADRPCTVDQPRKGGITQPAQARLPVSVCRWLSSARSLCHSWRFARGAYRPRRTHALDSAFRARQAKG